MGKRVICYIQAFDCEHTIEAAMRSVLNQTYDNWLCFVLSNGNKNTAKAPNWSLDIIRSVAAQDSRFVVLNKRGNYINMYIPTLYYLANRFPDSYICSLDADDEYQSDFFERGVAFAESRRLDIAACGTEIIQKEDVTARDGVLLSRREVKEDLMIEGVDFTRLFPVYKPFFNEMWGKLYRTELFGPSYGRKYAKRHFFGRFLPDTLFTVDNLSRSERIGLLSGTSHKFYQYRRRRANNATSLANSSTVNRKYSLFHGRHLLSVYSTHETVMSFLRSRGEITEDLYEYIQAVLFGWYRDYYTRTLLTTQREKSFAVLASELVLHPKFDEVMLYQDSGKYDNLRDYIRRREFCRQLYHLTVCQEALRNSGPQIQIGPVLLDRKCSLSTRRRLARVAEKLERTLRALPELGGD